MHITLKQLSIGLPALLLTLNVIAISPAFAEEGTSDSVTSTSAESGETTSGKRGRTQPRTVAITTDETTTSDRDNGSPREQAKARVAELRKNGKSQTDEQRTKKCDAKKVGIQNRFNNIVNKSQKIQDKITEIYGKGTTYVTTKNLSPENYATLTAAADAAKAQSEASIAALKAATPTIDCTNKEVATEIATFKATAQQVKTDLKAYRTAVHAVFKSIRASAQAAKTTDDSNDDEATTTPAPTTGGTQ